MDHEDNGTFATFVRDAAAAHGQDRAVVLKGETIPDEEISFEELDQQSAELARGLIARGVGKGSRVGFIFGNGPMFAVMLAAIARIGAIAIPISTMIKANELVRVLRQSDAGGLIVQRHFLGTDYVERLCEALPALRESDGSMLRMPETPFLRWVASTGGDLPPGIVSLDTLREGAASVGADLLAAIESEVHSTDQMLEIYTSGSMALPKGVKHSHGAVVFRARYMATMLPLAKGKEANAVLPMFWVGGLIMYLLPNWYLGGVTLCTERTLSNSRMAMGSVLAQEDLELMSRSRSTIWALGMTETIGPYSYGDVLRVPGYPLCPPIDHVASGYEVRVADAEGAAVPDGGVGEIQVRGYPLALGLHKIEPSKYLTPDGFYHTGDLGLVEGGRIHFVGRDGDMIKTAGSNVSPAEVELEMQQIDGIESAYVVGLPDPERGQLVVAAVVAREEAALDFEEVQKLLRQRLSPYKVPRAYVAIRRSEVPLLHSNKVARRQIERMVAQALGRELSP